HHKLAVLAACCLGAGAAHAAAPAVKIGILTDMSGTYAAMGGAGSVAAAQLAIDDCLANECKGMDISLVSADNQNKADIGAAKAIEWFDRDGDTGRGDRTNRAVELAAKDVAREYNRAAMLSGPATNVHTNVKGPRAGSHWMFDVYSQSVGGMK